MTVLVFWLSIVAMATAERSPGAPPCVSVERTQELDETLRTLDPTSPAATSYVKSLVAVIADKRCPTVLRRGLGCCLVGSASRPLRPCLCF